MDSNLRAKGFKPTLGDPCLFRNVQSDGSKILVCVYVGDVSYACVDQATADGFLSEMRELFEIEDGEGAPIEWLLGMAITQDLKNGTVKMNMEMAITKLAGAVLSPEEKRKAEGVDTPMVTCGLQKLWMYYGTSVWCGRTTVLVYGGGALDCPTQALEGSVGCPTLSACIRGQGLPTTAKGPWGGPC